MVNPERALPFIAFIVFVDMCGVGLIIPVLPSLIQGLASVGVQRAAELGGWLIFSYAAMQFVFAPVIGGLSDRFGRRPVLLGTLVALGFDYALMGFAPSFGLLFAGRMLSGAFGASWAAANSCVADITTPETRGRAFGMLGGAGAIGFVAGPAIGGALSFFGDRAPFMAACVLVLSGAVAGYRLLPETLVPDRQRQFSALRANPLGNLIQIAKSTKVSGLLATIFMMQLATQANFVVWSYYTILKFGWSSLMIGLSVAVYGALMAAVQAGLSGPLFARLGEARTGMLGLLCAIPAYLIIAFSTSSWMLFAGMVAGTLGQLTFPAIQSLMTKATAENAQGELQGAVASTIGITSIIGPVMMSACFAQFADQSGFYFPGAPFALSALLAGVAAVIFARVTRPGST